MSKLLSHGKQSKGEEEVVACLRNAVKTAVGALKNTEDVLHESLAAKNQQISEVENHHTIIEKIIQAKEEVAEFLQKRLDEAQEDLKQKENGLAALKEKLREYGGDSERRLRNRRSSEFEIDEDAYFERARTQLQIVEVDIAGLNRQIRTLEKGIKAKDREIQDLSAEHDELTTQSSRYDETIAHLERQMEEISGIVQRKKEEKGRTQATAGPSPSFEDWLGTAAQDVADRDDDLQSVAWSSTPPTPSPAAELRLDSSAGFILSNGTWSSSGSASPSPPPRIES